MNQLKTKQNNCQKKTSPHHALLETHMEFYSTCWLLSYAVWYRSFFITAVFVENNLLSVFCLSTVLYEMKNKRFFLYFPYVSIDGSLHKNGLAWNGMSHRKVKMRKQTTKVRKTTYWTLRDIVDFLRNQNEKKKNHSTRVKVMGEKSPICKATTPTSTNEMENNSYGFYFHHSQQCSCSLIHSFLMQDVNTRRTIFYFPIHLRHYCVDCMLCIVIMVAAMSVKKKLS